MVHCKHMASFTLLVTSAPFSQQDAYSAYRFALAATEAQHKVLGVFFYQSGTLNANDLQIGPTNEFDMLNAWKGLANEHQIPLMVCVSAASRRGITSSEDAQEADKQQHSLTSPFESVGLGELAVLLKQTDRLVQF